MRAFPRLLLAAGSAALWAVHAMGHGEVIIGRTAAGRLVPHMDFPQPIPIPRSYFPNFTGYATGLIGFESAPLDEPDEDLYTLDAGSSVRAELIFTDGGATAAITNGPSLLQVGQSLEFGPPAFDYHPIYNIADPQAAPGTIYTFRFVLRDSGGTHADSEPFEIAITPACASDHNLSGDVSVQDIFDFLADYFINATLADFNRSGAITVQDVFDFLGAYFAGC